MSYPLPTDKLGDLAAAIQQLATWADARLPGTGIEVVSGHYTTNGAGDIQQTFATLRNVQCIICPAFLNLSGEPSWSQLTVPVFAVMSGTADNTIVARAYNQAGVAHANAKVQVCFYAWGTPA